MFSNIRGALSLSKIYTGKISRETSRRRIILLVPFAILAMEPWSHANGAAASDAGPKAVGTSVTLMARQHCGFNGGGSLPIRHKAIAGSDGRTRARSLTIDEDPSTNVHGGVQDNGVPINIFADHFRGMDFYDVGQVDVYGVITIVKAHQDGKGHFKDKFYFIHYKAPSNNPANPFSALTGDFEGWVTSKDLDHVIEYPCLGPGIGPPL